MRNLKLKLIACATAMLATTGAIASADAKMDKFIADLMGRMTLEEKLGQLNLGAGGNPQVINSNYGMDESARHGMVSAAGGSDMNLQRLAVEESRLGIPILFGLDVIHGYATTFPIPLATSCSWNLPMIERSAQIAAREATAAGISWTWSPMVDIARDARWGRIAEGGGEDPYLGGLIAAAMVRGYQGNNLKSDSTLLACFKHFALYGASEAGRDYNTVDMSRVNMYNYYLPPYKAAIDAGCGSGMSSFNVIDGVPATGNKWLLNELLRGEWGYDGLMVSDAGSVGEMRTHGMGDSKEVARLGINASLDMDMGSQCYLRNITQLLQEGKVTMATVDSCVRRILQAKYKLGLFDDPYKYLKLANDKKRQAYILSDANVAFARRLAAESIVLLKNTDGLLPLQSTLKQVAVVGPIGNKPSDLFGTWSTRPDGSKSLSVTAALQQAMGNGCTVTYSQGCVESEGYADYYNDQSAAKSAPMIEQAVASASSADVIVACVGETPGYSGEAKSRVDIGLPPSQRALLKALKATGKPVVIVVFSGRPLVLTDEDRNFGTIVEAWHGGTQAAQALADVLTGSVNPSAKTTVTFPRFTGQIPIYYNHLNTGRPLGEFWATSKYIDIPLQDNSPLYPFGYGLSYNTYDYGTLTASKTEAVGDADSIELTIPVTNRGNRDGKEIVQLYVTDPVASISRPVLELKGFQKLDFAPGQQRTVTFTVTTDMLKFYNSELKNDWEEGEFVLSVGPNSRDLKQVKVNWKK